MSPNKTFQGRVVSTEMTHLVELQDGQLVKLTEHVRTFTDKNIELLATSVTRGQQTNFSTISGYERWTMVEPKSVSEEIVDKAFLRFKNRDLLEAGALGTKRASAAPTGPLVAPIAHGIVAPKFVGPVFPGFGLRDVRPLSEKQA